MSEDLVENDDPKIDQTVPDNEQLKNLLNIMKNIPPAGRKQMLANFAANNSINPEAKEYSSMTKKELLREKMKRRLQGMKNTRTSKRTLNNYRKRQLDKLQEAAKKDKKVDNDESTIQNLEDIAGESSEEEKN